jgi:transcriptional regulator with XRE-family HTH domain
VGPLIRDWRHRRRLSQLDLALRAGVSARHLSFVETGRSRPSAEMVLTLSRWLEVPLRERNRLLMAAGHAPAFEQQDLDDDAMAPVRDALRLVLDAHRPNPRRPWSTAPGSWSPPTTGSPCSPRASPHTCSRPR